MELKKKDLLECFDCYCVGYCELQDELSPLARTGYTSGIYGWNADCFQIHRKMLVTGYRPFGKRLSASGIEAIKEAYKRYKNCRNTFDYLECIYMILVGEAFLNE